MRMKISELRAGIGVEVSGINLNSGLSSSEFAELQEAIDIYGVCFFRAQSLEDAGLISLGQQFGPLETPLKRDQYGGIDKKLTMLANVDDGGNIIKDDDTHRLFMKGNLLWHSDSSYKPVPCTYSLLVAHEVPSVGGNTEFADMRACYDDWQGPFGETTKEELEDLICEHSIIYSRSLIVGDIFTDKEKKMFNPPRQPLVRTHPRTGRKIYYVGSHCSHVIGWPIEKGRALVRELSGFCIRPEHIYSHEWQVGDVVIWDNRSVLHRGLTYDPNQRRVMHRATVAGDGPLLF